MGLRINQNVEAFNSHRHLANTNNLLAKSMARLSSGLRINSAADDAAGLGISERMRGQVSGLAQAQRNTQDGIGLVQTAEASLNEASSMLLRIRDLAVQYSNGLMTATDKAVITAEVTELSSQLTSMITSAKFNGVTLLGGGSVTLQVGANDAETLTVTNTTLATSLGTAVSSFATLAGAGNPSITMLDDAIAAVSTSREMYGSTQSRLEHTLNVLASSQEYMMAAESRIRDLDVAEEMSTFTRLSVLAQSGTAILAQANQAPQNVLSLMRS